jgi:hypothetical protein
VTYPAKRPNNEKITIKNMFKICAILVKEIDKIREAIGVDRGALIKVWLYDKVRQDKAERSQ